MQRWVKSCVEADAVRYPHVRAERLREETELLDKAGPGCEPEHV